MLHLRSNSRTTMSWSSLLGVYFLFYLTTLCAAQDASATPFLPWTNDVASSTTRSEPSKTSAAPARTFTVQVGNGDHKFKPEVTNAGMGDIVEFWFYPNNHSVIRAEFEFPCIPYELTGRDKQGFWSGFFPVDSFLDPPKFQVKINDTDPIFFYCSAPGSCIDQGMVGVINPRTSGEITRQKELALDSAYQLSPGEPVPAESPLPSNLPTDAPIAPHPESKSHKLGTGAIAGIAVGAVSVIVLGCLLFFFWGRSKSLKEEIKRNEKLVQALSPVSPNPSAHSGRSGHSAASSTNSPNLAVPASFPHYSRPTPPYGPLPTPPTAAQVQPRLHLQVPGQQPHLQQHPAYHPPTVKYVSQMPATAPEIGEARAPSPRPPPPTTQPSAISLETPIGQVIRSPPLNNERTPVSFISTPISYYHGRTATTQPQGSPDPNEKAMSPLDPNKGGVPVGPYGRQMQEWHAQNQSRSPDQKIDVPMSATPTRGPAPPYYEIVASPPLLQQQQQSRSRSQSQSQQPELHLLTQMMAAPPQRPTIHHVNQQLGPAEIDGSPVLTRGGRF